MSPELQALEQRIAALENNRIPFDMDAVNQRNLRIVMQGIRPMFVGSVASDATISYAPDNWTCSSGGTGSYTITHNLGYSDYVVIPIVTGINTRACAVSVAANSFTVTIGNSLNSAGENNAFLFLMFKR